VRWAAVSHRQGVKDLYQKARVGQVAVGVYSTSIAASVRFFSAAELRNRGLSDSIGTPPATEWQAYPCLMLV
jgi:hypothetical protein